ncbi:MAG: hypothetical protein DRH30_02985 [Deltaproteobacteria bacterium]|nr:DUF2723 domain-containing protein [Deltaproteobacteria bacterium]MBW1903982.1 DUF2723 domain-containing protein [Deltaproteobacteria bacterium]MBW2159231.1 DUF2723 domain-containing protein [Deltaproteobacteria bacterium]MBW2213525.1 DUF2723 domain-containing protein [Deltaproteobacteria bacterium]MBW2379340.1 DUF2723 domain-containing protein [Deltaproteobacteria bacterium]
MGPDDAKRRRTGGRLLVRWFWIVPLGFYLLTVSRTPGWVDAPLLARMAHRMELSTWVNNHNLFNLLGGVWLRLTPESIEPHYSLNVLCALLGAMTVYVVFLIGLCLTQNAFASVLGALVLMVSHSMWWHSTMLEVYTLSTLLLTILVLFVIRYEQGRRFADLCVATLAFGLACSNHVQMSLVGIGFLALLTTRDSRRGVFRATNLLVLMVCFLLGFQLYLWVFISELVTYLPFVEDAGALVTTLGAMFERTSGAEFKQYMFPPGLSIRERLFWWGFYGGFFVYNFPPPWLLLAPVGLMAWLKKKDHRVSFAFLAIALAAQVVWSANYFVWDMFAFSLPAYVMTSILIIVGIDWVYRRGSGLRTLVYVFTPTVLLIPWLYASVPGWISRSEQSIGLLDRIPQYAQVTAFWNPLEYFFNPNKRSYDRVERYAAAILPALEPQACFWGNEATMFYPLKYYYQDVLGERADVSYQLVFGIIETQAQLEYHASTMLTHLTRGCPVYISSLGYPERQVLNYVYHRLSPGVELARITRLSQNEIVESFPDYRFSVVEVDPVAGARIYRLERR